MIAGSITQLPRTSFDEEFDLTAELSVFDPVKTDPTVTKQSDTKMLTVGTPSQEHCRQENLGLKNGEINLSYQQYKLYIAHYR